MLFWHFKDSKLLNNILLDEINKIDLSLYDLNNLESFDKFALEEVFDKAQENHFNDLLKYS